ncbi:hypothetical protein CSOJ01_02943 [Colletotrichum sojae]|uniref:Uncharacterized protein n=1 Tax=Colletotrichum sojae TaxID=2175907 RepID=A0A8H6JPM5_9PEZI|nr:hypothetical protein CSOJ01_02943 [Colletotrichum sojae]
MENPAKVNSTPDVPDFYQRLRQQQRMTIPVAGEDAHDAPPPYEAPRPAAGGGGGGGGGPTSSTSASAPAEDSARRSSSSHADEHPGFLDGFLEGLLAPREQFSRLQDQKRQQRQGYHRNEPMTVERDVWEDRHWDHLDGRPGCLFSDGGGCCWSSREGCFCSDRGGGFLCSDRGGFACSDRGGAFCSDHGGCFCSRGREGMRR